MGGKFDRSKPVEHRRCVPGPDGSLFVIESAAGRGKKGTRSVVARYSELSAPGELVYEYAGRLQNSLCVTSSGAVYTVCSAGRVHSNRGGQWSSQRVSKASLHAISAVGELVVTGGDGACIWALREAAWERLAIDCFDTNSRVIQIAGTAPNDIYVVAKSWGYDGCSLAHFDGESWQPLEASTLNERRHKQLMKHGIPRRINSVYCRSREEVFLCGPFGDLLVGSPNRGWDLLAKLKGSRRMYCIGEIDGVIYVCWSKSGSMECGIKSWDGTELRDAHSDIMPWYMSSSRDRLYMTWHDGFGTSDGTTLKVHNAPCC